MSSVSPVVTAEPARALASAGAGAMAVRLGLIVAAALAVRLVALIALPVPITSDAVIYEGQAWRLAQGQGYVTETGLPTAFYPPLYSYFIAMFYVVFGRARFLVEVVQAILSALVCLAVYDIARQVWKRTDAALAAAVLVALDFALILYPRVFYAETLYTALVAVAMVAWVRAWRTDALSMYALFGVATGLATLTRPVLNFLPLVAVLAWPWAMAHGARRRLDGAAIRRWAAVTLVILVTFGVTLTPWLVRNARTFGRVSTEITSSTGTGLYLSYLPVGGRKFGMPDENDPLWLAGLRLKQQRTLTAEWERSAFLTREVGAYVREHPSVIVRLIPAKLAHLAWPFDWTLFDGIGRLDVTYVFVLPFLALGVVAAWRRGGLRATAPLWLLVLYTVAITVAFLGSPRYRAPIQPYLHVVAALALVLWIERRPSARRWLVGWGALLVAVALLIRR
jgi:4-amino-4-deoxy-L-arabinose transferase-like glycosyltransferase